MIVFVLAAVLATVVPNELCASGYAHAHRNVPRTVRDHVYNRYGLKLDQRKGWVIDHRLPLELGGSNAESNLFPQPRAEAKVKDREESRLHRAVCSGQMTLSTAQSEMLRNWTR